MPMCFMICALCSVLFVFQHDFLRKPTWFSQRYSLLPVALAILSVVILVNSFNLHICFDAHLASVRRLETGLETGLTTRTMPQPRFLQGMQGMKRLETSLEMRLTSRIRPLPWFLRGMRRLETSLETRLMVKSIVFVRFL